jgi:hypothetical protein
VKKGEKGIVILAPVVVNRKNSQEAQKRTERKRPRRADSNQIVTLLFLTGSSEIMSGGLTKTFFLT